MVNGPAVGITAAGALFVVAGIKGLSVTGVIQDVVTGKNPRTAIANQFSSNVGAPVPANGVGITSPNGSAIATDAIQYKGAGYVWGGAPAKGIGNWDCSSFANWVCGHDVGLPIPGYNAGAYNGSSHGPVTGMWLAWSGLTTIGHDGSVAQAGDICVWETHMGIALGPNEMISAENPTDGTQISSINGFIAGELLFVRRYK